MFNGSFGKGPKATPPVEKNASKLRGVEVQEDDPETTWGMWESALAELDPSLSVLPDVMQQQPDFSAETQPMEWEEKTPLQRKNDALVVVEMHHQRVANTIRTLWGDKDCSTYISKLILDGDDGMGHARAGFNQEAVVAMMDLAALHEEEFGASD